MKEFYSYKRDGITQSLLGTFLTCRQKAYWQLQGWTQPHASGGLTYGTIIHYVLEQIYGRVESGQYKKPPQMKTILQELRNAEKIWRIENPRPTRYALENLETSLLIAEATLPVYFDYWKKEDFSQIKWRALEQQFAIPYSVPDGRTTIIRGKKDGVFGNPSLKLFETKTKSMFNEDDLVDTLWFELQVNLYTWALKQIYKRNPDGVLYNIIRRSGLRRNQKETLPVFAKRVGDDIAKRPEFYFVRMEIKCPPAQMIKFDKELQAMVIDFMDWWDAKETKTYKNTHQCIDKYGRCQFLELCSDNNFTRFTKRKQVFNELESF